MLSFRTYKNLEQNRKRKYDAWDVFHTGLPKPQKGQDPLLLLPWAEKSGVIHNIIDRIALMYAFRCSAICKHPTET